MDNGKIRNFKDLIAWQQGHELVLAIYKCTKDFPPSEKFGLTDQLRRATVSITSCLAEGFSRKTNKDKLNFYKMATGSLSETDNQITIAFDLGYMDKDEYDRLLCLVDSVGRLINGLCRATLAGKYKGYSE